MLSTIYYHHLEGNRCFGPYHKRPQTKVALAYGCDDTWPALGACSDRSEVAAILVPTQSADGHRKNYRRHHYRKVIIYVLCF
jgi:hypothetical protein